MSEDPALVELYRTLPQDAPSTALDRTILNAARAASWRRRNARPLAALALAACAALAIGIGSLRHAPQSAFVADTDGALRGLRDGRARALLIDPDATRAATMEQRPGMTARVPE